MLAQPLLCVKRFFQKKRKKFEATRQNRLKSHKNTPDKAKTRFDNKLWQSGGFGLFGRFWGVADLSAEGRILNPGMSKMLNLHLQDGLMRPLFV